MKLHRGIAIFTYSTTLALMVMSAYGLFGCGGADLDQLELPAELELQPELQPAEGADVVNVIVVGTTGAAGTASIVNVPPKPRCSTSCHVLGVSELPFGHP